jgi:hypothetical protein
MKQHLERYWVIKYSILTIALFLPLLWSFRYVRNLYPFTVWNVMMAGGDLASDRSYCVLRGETISGETIDIRATSLTNAMSNETGAWSTLPSLIKVSSSLRSILTTRYYSNRSEELNSYLLALA